MQTLRLVANRRYPDLPGVTGDPRSHTRILEAIRECIQTHERRTPDVLNSFVRIQDLIDLGLVTLSTNPVPTISADPSSGGGTSTPDVEPVVVRGCTFASSSGALVAASTPMVDVYIPFNGTIIGVVLTTIGGPGACVVDIWKDDYAAAPPTVLDTITASAKPTIPASGHTARDLVLTGWDVDLLEGDVLRFKLDSVTAFTHIFVSLIIQPETT